MIYLDNAATTLKKPAGVVEAVEKAMTSMGNASRGMGAAALQAARSIYDTRTKIAELFGCKRPDHVIFTANATEALNIAICGAIPRGAHVITTDWEHNSVLRPLYYLEREYDVHLDFVRAGAQGGNDACADHSGTICYDAFETLICPQTAAIVCTHASNLTGNLLDLERVGKIAAKHGLLFVVDASQTAGAIPIDMERMGIDLLCFTGHKGLMGPQGTGGMCIREGIEVRPWKYGGTGVHSYDRTQPSQYPERLEAGTLNTHGLAGLSAAIDYIRETGVLSIHAKEIALMRQFYEAVSTIEGVTVYGDFSTMNRCAIVALNIREYDSARIADILSEDYGIAVRAGAHCAPRMHQALRTDEQGAVRFSFSCFNTKEEVACAIAALRELAG